MDQETSATIIKLVELLSEALKKNRTLEINYKLIKDKLDETSRELKEAKEELEELA